MKKSACILLVIVLTLIAIGVPKRLVFGNYNYDDAVRYAAGGCEIAGREKNIDINWAASKVNVACLMGMRLSSRKRSPTR